MPSAAGTGGQADRAIVIAGAFAGRHILREEIDGHPLGIGQEGSELLRESDLHARCGNRGSLTRSGRVRSVGCARRNDEPHTTHALPVDITRLLVPDEVVERDVVVRDLLGAIGALDGGQLAWHAGRQGHPLRWGEGRPRLGAVVITRALTRRGIGRKEVERVPLGIGQKRPHRGILSDREEGILLRRGAVDRQWQHHRKGDDGKNLSKRLMMLSLLRLPS